jgi:putative oxidoreductase
MAVRVLEHGGRDKLVYGEYPLPELGEHDVLVKVHTASVSFYDVKYREGIAAGAMGYRLPQQLGREAAGEVVAVGPAVQRFKPGDHGALVVHPPVQGSLYEIRGQGNLAQSPETPGSRDFGGYAQYLVRGEHMWWPVPPDADLEQAAVTLWAFATAHRVVRDRLQVHLGDTVLIHGASGGMGQATGQVARLFGARVIATTRSERKADLLRALGADRVVVTDDLERCKAEVAKFVGEAGLDHAVDYTSNHDLIRFAADSLRRGGNLVLAANVQGDPRERLPLVAGDFVGKELTVLGLTGSRPHDGRMALKLLGEGRIHTRIAARFPLREVARAHELLESGQEVVGRVVLDPWA